MIIDCISDLHGHYPKLEGGDLLIVAGDLTARDTKEEYYDFFHWIQNQIYKKIIFISGNHDGWMEKNQKNWQMKTEDIDIIYLCDSGTEFEGLKIWGSPWTKISGMNSNCKAFTKFTDQDLEEKWKLIPDDVDILVTHSPPRDFFDRIGMLYINCGSISLRNHVITRIKPKLHVFGHIHEDGGKILDTNVTKFVNASYVDENYKPVNKAVKIEL